MGEWVGEGGIGIMDEGGIGITNEGGGTDREAARTGGRHGQGGGTDKRSITDEGMAVGGVSLTSPFTPRSHFLAACS